MTWKTFRKVVELTGGLKARLVVDELIPRIAWSLHEACGTEVLFYVRRVADETYGRGEPPQVTFYLIVNDPFKDIYIPLQRVSSSDVKVGEPAPLEYSYAVVHTHPPGVKGFSRVDKEYINTNHVVSLLVESGRVADARVTLSMGDVVAQVKPEVIVARRKASLALKLKGVKGVRSASPGEGLIKCYAEEVARRLLAMSQGRIDGCSATS